jgi:hypothetical protein
MVSATETAYTARQRNAEKQGEATSRTIYSVWEADQDTDSDDGATGSVASRGIVP